MTKFKRWSRIVHSVLAKFHRKVKLSQAQEILAAYFGHRTYASLCRHDLAVLEGQAKYVLTDPAMALDRAADLDIPLHADDWHTVEAAIRPSGVAGDTWLIDERSMHGAARITFEDSSDPRIYEVIQVPGIPDGLRALDAHCQSSQGTFPDELKFRVDGEIRFITARNHLSFPVICEVVFPRVGVRFYAHGELRSIDRAGPSREYEPEDDIVDYSYLSESDG